MTPEQRDWFEYGKRLNAIEEVKRANGIREWRSSFKPAVDLRRSLIADALEARKRAHSWNPPEGRNCSNCLHERVRSGDMPCIECSVCFLAPERGFYQSKWEPRRRA